MNRRAVSTVILLVGAGVALVLILRSGTTARILWERGLPEGEYVHCLSTRVDGERSILVVGIQQNNIGSRDFDNYIVCFDLATGGEIWKRRESQMGNLRGWKRPSSIGFDYSGDLIVGWDYGAVREGEYEVVSKLSAIDGSTIWEWTAHSEGSRSGGYSHEAWIFCDEHDAFVKTVRSVGTDKGNADMRTIYSVIDTRTGAPGANPSASPADAEARWLSKQNSLGYVAADGSEVTWGIHRYEHTETNWLRWHKEDGIWMPRSHWERRERVQVSRVPPHSPTTAEQFIVGRDEERALVLLHDDRAPAPSAVLLVDMSEEAESRGWRVVRLSGGRSLGRTMAYGTGISHNYDGPIRLTENGFLVISGAMLHDQSPQKITVWK